MYRLPFAHYFGSKSSPFQCKSEVTPRFHRPETGPTTKPNPCGHCPQTARSPDSFIFNVAAQSLVYARLATLCTVSPRPVCKSAESRAQVPVALQAASSAETPEAIAAPTTATRRSIAMAMLSLPPERGVGGGGGQRMDATREPRAASKSPQPRPSTVETESGQQAGFLLVVHAIPFCYTRHRVSLRCITTLWSTIPRCLCILGDAILQNTALCTADSCRVIEIPSMLLRYTVLCHCCVLCYTAL